MTGTYVALVSASQYAYSVAFGAAVVPLAEDASTEKFFAAVSSTDPRFGMLNCLCAVASGVLDSVTPQYVVSVHDVKYFPETVAKSVEDIFIVQPELSDFGVTV